MLSYLLAGDPKKKGVEASLFIIEMFLTLTYISVLPSIVPFKFYGFTLK